MSSRSLPFVLLSGMLFGAGLAVSSMLSPEVILDFLRWRDLGLLLVLGGAVMVTLLTYQLAPRVLGKPVVGAAFAAHAAVLDRRTIGGAALFGIGWGLCGVCPGPAIAGLGAGNHPMWFALVGLFAGAYLQGRLAGGPGDRSRSTAGPQTDRA